MWSAHKYGAKGLSSSSRHTPSVEIALKHFSALEVKGGGDVVTMFAVEGKLIARGRAGTGEAPICGNICRCLRADASSETISI